MITIGGMTPAPTMLRLDDDVREAMETLKDRDGIPYNTQANKALRAWLEQKGVLVKKASKK
jgi:hypothetical protein